MNYKNEAKEAIKRVERIIQAWEENKIGSYEALELLTPDLKTIITHFEMIQDKVSEVCYKKNNDPEENKRSLYEDLEKGLNDESDLKLFDPIKK